MMKAATIATDSRSDFILARCINLCRLLSFRSCSFVDSLAWNIFSLSIEHRGASQIRKKNKNRNKQTKEAKIRIISYEMISMSVLCVRVNVT